MPKSCEPQRNHLLAALSAAERERIFPHLQLVSMPLGKVLSEPRNVQRYGYFPIDCIISFSYLMKDGASTEIAVAGHEGLVGLALFTGGTKNPEQSSCAECRRRLPAGGRAAQSRVSPRRWIARRASALHTRGDDANCPDSGLHPASHSGPTTVSLLVGVPRPGVIQPATPDPREHIQHARSASGRG